MKADLYLSLFRVKRRRPCSSLTGTTPCCLPAGCGNQDLVALEIVSSDRIDDSMPGWQAILFFNLQVSSMI